MSEQSAQPTQPVRRRRTWYKRRIRNRRILLAVIVLGAIAALCWIGPSFFQYSEVDFSDSAPTPKPAKVRGATPEDLGKLAEQGDAEAQWRLGTLYRNGDGVRQSDTDANDWFRRAAEQRYVPAMSSLGSQYWAGRGVSQDYNKAYFWYDVALAQGDLNSEAFLEDLATELTQDEVANVHQQAKAWLQAHSCTLPPAVPPSSAAPGATPSQ
ncbi:MAG: tetratricopeptide repeat protein [Terriglobales bacterium]